MPPTSMRKQNLGSMFPPLNDRDIVTVLQEIECIEKEFEGKVANNESVQELERVLNKWQQERKKVSVDRLRESWRDRLQKRISNGPSDEKSIDNKVRNWIDVRAKKFAQMTTLLEKRSETEAASLNQ